MADQEQHKEQVLTTIHSLFCYAPVVKDLTPVQLAALHVFKHEFLAAGYRLYEQIPAQVAHPILVGFLKRLSDELLNDSGSPEPSSVTPAA